MCGGGELVELSALRAGYTGNGNATADANGERRARASARERGVGSAVRGGLSARAKCGNGKYGVLEQKYKRTRRHGAHTTRRISAVTPESAVPVRYSAERRTRHDRAEHASFNPKSTHQASEK